MIFHKTNRLLRQAVCFYFLICAYKMKCSFIMDDRECSFILLQLQWIWSLRCLTFTMPP